MDKQENNRKPFLVGKPASAGTASGFAKIVFNLENSSKFNEGDILVTKMTEPSMTPIMLRAAAIITDSGGITCHAAIISRELGIPCVVATQEATKVLQNGTKIIVDGTEGKVYLDE